MSWSVLISAPYMLPIIDRFADFFAENDVEPILADVQERLEEADLLPLVPDIHGMVCGDDRITARVLDAAAKLCVISKWGTGIDSIDAAAAAARGIRVCRTPNAFSEPVADTVLGYILAFARNIPFLDQHMKEGTWEKIPGRALNESAIGVIGVGNVGKAVLRRAKAFGTRLLGTDVRKVDSAFIAEIGVEMVDLERLLQESDFVSLNCDLNPTSRHLMNDRTFPLMKPTAVIVSTARGPIIDEAALVRALASGRIAGAGLDVFEDEPLPARSPLRAMGRCLLAPHNSNSSPKAWERVHWNTLNMLVEGLRTGRTAPQAAARGAA